MTMLYKRGGRWWYKFKFAGRVFREPTKTNSKEIAGRAERNRRRELEDVSRYQQHRLREGAAAKTINLEIGTLRAILRRHRLWASIQPDVRMLPARDDIGRALTPDEEKDLLDACSESRS